MLTHKGTQIIQTDRLLLRPFRMEDARAMYDNWASDLEVTKYLSWPAHDSPAVTRSVLQDWVSNYVNQDYYQWAMVSKKMGLPIGSIGVVSHSDRAAKAHMGYCMGRPWWHQGYMTEALSAVMDFLFDEVGFQRIEAQYDTRNPHSGGVMQKCGMTYEGTHRRSACTTSGICDTAWYAILADERKK